MGLTQDFCPTCWHENVIGDRFCAGCGRSLRALDAPLVVSGSAIVPPAPTLRRSAATTPRRSAGLHLLLTGVKRLALLVAAVAVAAVLLAAVVFISMSTDGADPESPAADLLGAAQPETPNADGIGLGSAREAFEAVHGPSLDDPSSAIASYDIEGFGPRFWVVYYEGHAISLGLFADRNPGGEALSVPHEADWTVAEALAIARRFSPPGTVLGAPRPSDSGNVIYAATSAALAGVFGPDAYAFGGALGAPGELEYTLFLDEAGEIFAIDIQLGGSED